ncbi:hypothetical protein QBC47DRAFT_443677 [Echria macrotheca]|uniref:Uncharacterized protein n=1 Tax=Echria macrotheca TaxID=438768 RepID=A0AAJ0BHL9_9PEZI|nr:hypothetical protein QBC47DRAFT_443677 [Echria macrotheca]
MPDVTPIPPHPDFDLFQQRQQRKSTSMTTGVASLLNPAPAEEAESDQISAQGTKAAAEPATADAAAAAPPPSNSQDDPSKITNGHPPEKPPTDTTVPATGGKNVPAVGEAATDSQPVIAVIPEKDRLQEVQECIEEIKNQPTTAEDWVLFLEGELIKVSKQLLDCKKLLQLEQEFSAKVVLQLKAVSGAHKELPHVDNELISLLKAKHATFAAGHKHETKIGLDVPAGLSLKDIEL